MSKTLVTAMVAVFGLTTLAGCSHFHDDPAPVYTPVETAPAPTVEPSYNSKYR